MISPRPKPGNHLGNEVIPARPEIARSGTVERKDTTRLGQAAGGYCILWLGLTQRRAMLTRR